MDIVQQLGTALGLGLLSGVRLYLTILVIGAAVRFHWFQLTDSFPGLAILADWRVMVVAATACLIEFVADKVPWVDSAWDSVHTFIRPIGAALLGANAFSQSDPALRVMLVILCSGVALTGHSAKSATRLAVNHSPEPFTNIALSLAGDIAVPVATWFTFKFPVVTFGFVALFLAVAWWLSPKIYRMMRMELTGVRAALSRWFGAEVHSVDAGCKLALPANAPPELAAHMQPIPREWLETLERRGYLVESGAGLYCAACKSIPGLRASIGYLVFTSDAKIVFITRRWFRARFFEVLAPQASALAWSGHFVADRFSFNYQGKLREFEVFRTSVAAPAQASRTVPA